MGNIATVCGRGKVKPSKGKRGRKKGKARGGEGPAEAEVVEEPVLAEAATRGSLLAQDAEGLEGGRRAEEEGVEGAEAGEGAVSSRPRPATGSGPMEVDTAPLPLEVRNREAEEGGYPGDLEAAPMTGVASHRLSEAEAQLEKGDPHAAVMGAQSAPAPQEGIEAATPSKVAGKGGAGAESSSSAEPPSEVPQWVSRVLVPAGAFLGLVVGSAVRKRGKRGEDEYYEPVKEGSCLYRIGVENETTVDDIAKANDDRHGISLTPDHEYGHYSEEFYGFGDPNLIWPAEEFHKPHSSKTAAANKA